MVGRDPASLGRGPSPKPDPDSDRPTARATCYVCSKPRVVCVCDRITRVANQTPVTIIQHPREAGHPFGTVRFARLGLDQVDVLVPSHPREPIEWTPPPGTGLLYPSDDADDLATTATPPKHLLVIDGTWAQARSLVRFNPWLRKLPCYKLSPEQGSRYIIRREPSEDYISTIEAIVEALKHIEPNTPGLDDLVRSFSSMIADQLDYRETPNPRFRVRPKVAPSRAVPPILHEAPERVILIYAEISHDHRRDYEMVCFAAMKLDTGERFFRYVRPRRLELFVPRLPHMGIDIADVNSGCTPSELTEAFDAFAGPDAVLAAWNVSTFDAYFYDRPARETIVLKTAYCNHRRRKCGSVQEVLPFEGLAPIEPPFIGRPGEVMAHLYPIARLLSGEAPTSDRA